MTVDARSSRRGAWASGWGGIAVLSLPPALQVLAEACRVTGNAFMLKPVLY